jgi:hypothetical protein
MPRFDKWSRWLAETRFGGDQNTTETLMRGLIKLRDRLLKKAGLVRERSYSMWAPARE